MDTTACQTVGPRRELARAAGLMINARRERPALWDGSAHLPDLIWQVGVSVPFSYAVSKNQVYVTRRRGHIALRRKVRALRDEITLRLRIALSGRRVAHNKVWISILAEKPNHRGDAINVIDLVCDAVKAALPVDDRWFSLRYVDWLIVKCDPQLHIKIGQESDQDCQVCSHCGHIRPFRDFSRRRQSWLGIDWKCLLCRREGRELGRITHGEQRQ